MKLRALLTDRRFLAGLVLRLVIIALAAPAWPASGDGFGWPQLLVFGPVAWLGAVLGGVAGAGVAARAVILVCDVVILGLLVKMARHRRWRSMATAYWFSPISLFAAYGLARPEYLAVMLLMAAMFGFLTARRTLAGVALGLAISAEPLLALMTPFIALYLLARPRLRAVAVKPLAIAAAIAAVLTAPFLLIGGWQALAPQTLAAAVSVAPGLVIYLAPLAGAALFYAAWRARRMDFDLLWTFVGLAAMTLLMLSPMSPGLAVIALPFIVAHTLHSGPTGQILYVAFAIALAVLASIGASYGVAVFDYGAAFAGAGQSVPASILLTATLGMGAALMVQMFRRGLVGSPFHRALRQTLSIGVSGDSGAGKDTLADSIIAMFGAKSVVHVSGDDYHLWDRQKPMWRALTHLNPQANDLPAFFSDVANLIDKRPVMARHYDHATGRMTKPHVRQPADVVLASGLHALWSPSLAERYDIRVYLDMDENLRRMLKIRRDVHVRGHDLAKVTASIARREIDAARFIRPQAEVADVVLRLEARHHSVLDDVMSTALPAMRLIVIAQAGESFDRLARILTALCGMHVIESPRDDGRVEVMIEGEPTLEDVAAAARRLAPAMEEILDLQPKWEPGLRGVMQLIMLEQIERVRQLRSVTV